MVESVGRAGRLVCVQEAAAGRRGDAVISHVAVEAFELLDAPPVMIAADPIPVPYARSLEENHAARRGADCRSGCGGRCGVTDPLRIESIETVPDPRAARAACTAAASTR